MIEKITMHPKVATIVATCTATEPALPNDSFITPAYVVASPARVDFIRKPTDIVDSQAMIVMIKRAGTTPRTLNAAGIDIIPAPIILVDTLKTTPEVDPCFSEDGSCFGKRGLLIGGDIFSTAGET